MTNSEYYGFTNDGKFTKHIDKLPKMLYNMNSIIKFLEWLRKEKAPQLTAKEKKFIADTVNSYAGLNINITTIKKVYDIEKNAYFLKFQSANGLEFSCFNEQAFNTLEEHKSYSIRELLGKD